MDVDEAVRTMFAVRSYQEQRVPGEVLRKVLEAGRLSASASNKQPWHFVVVQEPEMLQKIGEAMPKNAPYVAGAPLAIVVVVDRTRYAEMDAARAIQSMLLVAWGEGVGGNWTGGPTSLEPVKSLLGIPEDLDAVGVLPLGYPAESIGRGKKRRNALSEIVYRERWGQQFTE